MTNSPYTFLLIYAAVMASLIGSRGLPPIGILLGVLVITFSLTYSLYLFNDIMEIELDRLNNLQRPIAQGVVSKRDAETLVLLLMIIGVTVSYFLNFATFLLTILFLMLGVLYSIPQIYLKKRFLAKNVTTGIAAAVCSWIGGAAVGSLSPHVMYAGVLFFVIGFAGSTLSDLGDVLGDSERGVKSFAVVYGPEFALKVSIVSWISTVVSTLLLYLWLGFKIIVPVLITGAGLSIVFLSFSLMKRLHDEKYYRKTIKRIAGISLTYQLAVLLGVIL